MEKGGDFPQLPVTGWGSVKMLTPPRTSARELRRRKVRGSSWYPASTVLNAARMGLPAPEAWMSSARNMRGA